VVLGLAALSACGFEPVYGERGSASNLRGAVKLDDPATRNMFLLNEQLELRLGRAPDPRYGLTVRLDIAEEGLAITGRNDIERYNVLGRADFVLRNIATNQPLLSDRVSTFTAYSASEQPVATLAAARDARTRLMVALADKIVSKLLLAGPV
ncbi:MAG: LPS assembly lipoprotein LptE, partial [Pseudomonadota bacterium]